MKVKCLIILFYKKNVKINKTIKTIIKKYTTDFCSEDFNNQSNIYIYPFLVDRPELESGISRFVAERLIQFGQRSLIK